MDVEKVPVVLQPDFLVLVEIQRFLLHVYSRNQDFGFELACLESGRIEAVVAVDASEIKVAVRI